MYVRDHYLMARVGKDDTPAPLTRDEYNNLIGALAFLGKMFDVKVDVSTVYDNDNAGEPDVFVTYTVRVY